MKKVIIFFILIFLTSCSNKQEKNEISKSIYSQLKQSEWKVIDFSKTVPFQYEKVCILGPYTTNESAEQALGFYWDVQKETEISTNDGINLIVFIKENKVISYVEHSRAKGDFWKLSRKCLDYNSSILTRISKKDDWVY
jgi:hypothetical protein